MTLEEQTVFVNSPKWRDKVGQVARRVALQVQAESAGTANHAVRATLATSVLQDKAGAWNLPFTGAVATLNQLSATPTDQQLGTAVSSVWSAMAGAPGPP